MVTAEIGDQQPTMSSFQCYQDPAQVSTYANSGVTGFGGQDGLAGMSEDPDSDLPPDPNAEQTEGAGAGGSGGDEGSSGATTSSATSAGATGSSSAKPKDSSAGGLFDLCASKGILWTSFLCVLFSGTIWTI